MTRLWNWSQMKTYWNSLIDAVCCAIKQAVKHGADREIVEHWCRLLFKLDCGSINHWGLTDLHCLICREARRPQAAYALAPARRKLSRQLRSVYAPGWTNRA